MKKQGLFVVLEGIKGCGKSALSRALEPRLRERGIPFRMTREPGGTSLGESLRALMLRRRIEICSEAELLLMYSARIQHVAEVIEPALARGEFVLCDRYRDSSYAYQGSGRGLPWQRIELLEAALSPLPQPELTILLDLDPERGARRNDKANKSGKDLRFGQLGEDFGERVRRGYLERARTASDHRTSVIDAALPLEEVIHRVWALLEPLLAAPRDD